MAHEDLDFNPFYRALQVCSSVCYAFCLSVFRSCGGSEQSLALLDFLFVVTSQFQVSPKHYHS